MTDTNERLTAGRATGLLWLVGGKDTGKDRWITSAEADLHVHAT